MGTFNVDNRKLAYARRSILSHIDNTRKTKWESENRKFNAHGRKTIDIMPPEMKQLWRNKKPTDKQMGRMFDYFAVHDLPKKLYEDYYTALRGKVKSRDQYNRVNNIERRYMFKSKHTPSMYTIDPDYYKKTGRNFRNEVREDFAKHGDFYPKANRKVRFKPKSRFRKQWEAKHNTRLWRYLPRYMRKY